MNNITEARKYPNRIWSKYYLSMDSNLTVKDIETLILPHSHDDWMWDNISININIQEVRNNPNKPWNKYCLSWNEGLTVNDVETLILPNGTENWNWFALGKLVSAQYIIDNFNNPWTIESLALHEGFTPKMLEFFDAGLLKHLQKNIPKFRYHTDIVVKCDY